MAKSSHGMNTVLAVTEIVKPIVEGLGLSLWDVRFEKEGSSWYLRIFIDRDDAPVDVLDCEKVSRAVDEPLDKADPISQSYYLEVSSPGIERELTRKEHFGQFLGAPVTLKLIRPVNGQREFVGELLSYEEGAVTIKVDEQTQMTAQKGEIASVKLCDFFEQDYDDTDMGGQGE